MDLTIYQVNLIYMKHNTLERKVFSEKIILLYEFRVGKKFSNHRDAIYFLLPMVSSIPSFSCLTLALSLSFADTLWFSI